MKADARDARGVRTLDDAAGDIRFALRTLRRAPGFAVVAVLTLAIGIGGTTAVFSAVDRVLLAPLPYARPGQLVRLYNTSVQAPGDRGFVTPVHYLAYRDGLSSFSALAAVATYDAVGADIGSSDQAERIRVLPVSADYFDVVLVHPAVGVPFSHDDEHGGTREGLGAALVVVLSHALWERAFRGDPSAIGRTLTMNGKAYQVVGVMPAGFGDPIVPQAEAWTPINLDAGRDPSNASNHYLGAIGRLRPGVTMASAQAELAALSATLGRKYPEARDTRARIDPLKEDIVGPSAPALEIMLGAAALVLAIVCTNIATLMLVRASDRQREFAVRAALGGQRARIVRQMLVESMVLALAGAVAGLVIARGGMAAIVALGGGNIPRLQRLTLDPRLLAFSIAVATTSALVFGIAPALRVARVHPGEVLRTESRGGTGSGAQTRVRAVLVAAQVALAFVLVVGAGLLLSSFAALGRVDLGLRSANVLTFEAHLPDGRYDSTRRAAFYDDLDARLAEVPGIRAAGGTSRLPGTGSFNTWGTRPLTGPMLNVQRRTGPIEQRVVSGRYFEALAIPRLAGRLFDAGDDARAPRRVVISSRAADLLFPGVDAVGQRLDTGGYDWEVIGVVGDVALDVEGDRAPVVYHAHRQFAGDRNWSLVQVVSTTGSADAATAAARRTLAAMDPRLVLYRPATLDDVLGRGNATRAFTLRLLLVFAAVAVALAVLGLYGVLAYTVRLRTREFGIRMALGAEPRSIRSLVLRQGVVVITAGLLAGILGAAALSRVMTSLLFHVAPMDRSVIAAAAALLAAIGTLAAYVPARQATTVDPRSALS